MMMIKDTKKGSHAGDHKRSKRTKSLLIEERQTRKVDPKNSLCNLSRMTAAVEQKRILTKNDRFVRKEKRIEITQLKDQMKIERKKIYNRSVPDDSVDKCYT